MGRFVAATLFVAILGAPLARAQTPACEKLNGDKKQLAEQILKSQHPYDCCDGTLAECLKQPKVCALAWRLSENVCRRVAAKQDREKIERGLSRRARSMMSMGAKAKIDLNGAPMLGDAQAPVTLVEYACARCPFCSKITPQLHEAITEGPLKGKVKFYFKVFPIRGHEYSTESGLAFMAAIRMGHFWEYALHAYDLFDVFCPKKLGPWAGEVGLDRESFDKLLTDPGLRESLVASKKEGIINKVDATPTFFINGRKFYGDMTIEEMIDVLEEEYDRIQGVEYRD
jgi:hypothetical protein